MTLNTTRPKLHIVLLVPQSPKCQYFSCTANHFQVTVLFERSAPNYSKWHWLNYEAKGIPIMFYWPFLSLIYFVEQAHQMIHKWPWIPRSERCAIQILLAARVLNFNLPVLRSMISRFRVTGHFEMCTEWPHEWQVCSTSTPSPQISLFRSITTALLELQSVWKQVYRITWPLTHVSTISLQSQISTRFRSMASRFRVTNHFEICAPINSHMTLNTMR